MGIGPNQTSLLHKLGKRAAWEMSDLELHQLVAKEQERRTIQRALGRAAKMMEIDVDDGTYVPKVGRPRTKSRVKKAPAKLEDFGLKADLITKLRATGKPDFQLILELQGAGII